jgi:DNA invertase Pin-like site-specific DNA recombinase
MAGPKAARAQGKVGGRPTVMDPDKLAAARAPRARGESPTQIARALGISRASVCRHLGRDSQQDWAGPHTGML